MNNCFSLYFLENSSKPGIENLCMLSPGLAVFGPVGTVAAGFMLAGSVAVMGYKHAKV